VMSGKMVQEHWANVASTPGSQTPEGNGTFQMPRYDNAQVFRLGQGGPVSTWIGMSQGVFFSLMPSAFMLRFQAGAEGLFKALHTSESLSVLRSMLGWQHSPDGRGEVHQKPKGYLYTWAGWLDEVVNLMMGLQHVEVIFPLYPLDKAAKCVEKVLEFKHLAWWRLNIRAMGSEAFYLSSVHRPPTATPPANSSSTAFLRVDFVTPARLLQAAEPSLTAELHRVCPGWRKHWGKSLFTQDNHDAGWGDAKFAEVARRFDPDGKFCPRDLPGWVAKLLGC